MIRVERAASIAGILGLLAVAPLADRARADSPPAAPDAVKSSAPAATPAPTPAAPTKRATSKHSKTHAAAKPAAKPTVAAPGAAPGTASDTPANTAKAAPPGASSDSSVVMPGGEEGAVFKSLTVTGEDLIHVDFDRPELHVDVDPRKAPGLEWGDSRDMLRRSGVNLDAPLTALSKSDPSPFTGRPWLGLYRTGSVARFRPQMKDVNRWWLTIADSRSDTLATFEGKGNPPEEIAWDGRSRKGLAVPPGVTCSYVLEAIDRAGNRRSFVGAGFVLPAYRLLTPTAQALLFSGDDLGDAAALATSGASVPPILLETASWLNQIEPVGGPIEVKVSAHSFEDASRLAKGIVEALKPRVVGDPARIRAVADVRPDVPLRGTIVVTASVGAPKGSPKASG